MKDWIELRVDGVPTIIISKDEKNIALAISEELFIEIKKVMTQTVDNL